MKRILSLLMSVMITVSSLSCATATPVYADTIAGNYVSMSVMVSLLLSAYGIQRTIEGSQYINDLIQQCTQEASQTGFGMIKNGIQSIGVTIQNGVSYVSKSFAEWVYNWALSKDIYDISSEPVLEYFTFGLGNYVINDGIDFEELSKIADLPTNVYEKLSSDQYIVSGDPCVILLNRPSGQNYVRYRALTISPGTQISFTNSNLGPVSQNHICASVTYYLETGNVSSSVSHPTMGFYNTGDYTTSTGANDSYWNGLNGTITLDSDVDYGVTSDIPDISQDLDSYASDWVADGITADDEDYIPITLPIDSAGTAVGVVVGTTEAINDAGVIGQYDVREGTISNDAIEDLEQAVADSAAEEELKDDLSGFSFLSTVGFCSIHWAFKS